MKTDPALAAQKVLVQINENFERDGQSLRLVGVNFVKRGDYTLCIIHGSDLSPVNPINVVGFGFAKRHNGCKGCGIPPDESDRAEGYRFSRERAVDDVRIEYKKAVSKGAW